MPTFSKSLLLISLVTVVYFTNCEKQEPDDELSSESNITDSGTNKSCADPLALNYDSAATSGSDDCHYYQSDSSSSDAAAAMADVNEELNVFIYTSFEGNQSAKKTADTVPLPNCATVTVDPAGLLNWPKTVTIDFGQGCLGKDGKYRKGVLSTTITSNWFNYKEDASIQVDMVNYSVNDTVYQGSRIFTVLGKGMDSLAIQIDINEARTILPAGDTITRSGTIGLVMTEGFGTKKNSADDRYELVVDIAGKTRDALSYSLTTTNSLVHDRTCQDVCIFVAGSAVFNLSDYPTTYHVGGMSYDLLADLKTEMDFGLGSCDGLMSYSVRTTATLVQTGKELEEQTVGPIQIDCQEFFRSAE